MKKKLRRPAPLNRAGKIFVAAHILLPLIGIGVAAYFVIRSHPPRDTLVFPAIILVCIVVYVVTAILSARRDPRFTTGTFTAKDAAKWLGRGIVEAGITIVLDGLTTGGGSSSSGSSSGMSGGGGSFGGGGSSGSW